jgi:hypothetical protein
MIKTISYLPSQRVVSILRKRNYSLNKGKNTHLLVYLFLSEKWLVRLDKILFYIGRTHLSIRDIVNIKILFLYRDVTGNGDDLILLRDKEFCKISFFDLSGNAKTIIWENRADFSRALRGIEYFTNRGVECPPIIYKDCSENMIRQKIIGDIFKNNVDIRRIIETITKAQAKYDYANLFDEYVKMTSQLKINDRCSDALESKCSAAVEKGFISISKNVNLVVPEVLAHGDVSVANTLIDHDGVIYIDDFDRSFNCSIYHDLVFVYLRNNSFPKDLLIESVISIHQQLHINGMIKQSQIYNYVLSIFILDTIRYMEYICNSKLSSGAFKFSVHMINEAINSFQMAPE